MEFLVHYKGSCHFRATKVNHTIQWARALIYSRAEATRFKFMLCSEVRIKGEEEGCDNISRLFYLSYESLDKNYNKTNWGLVTPHMLYTIKALTVKPTKYAYEKE